MLEARKHLVQYLHSFPGVKQYRTQLVHVESPEDIHAVIGTISAEHHDLLDVTMTTDSSRELPTE